MSNKDKYLWSSAAFDKWVKDQQKMIRDTSGFKISTAGVTHKLVQDILVPNKIKLKFPSMQMVKRKNVRK